MGASAQTEPLSPKRDDGANGHQDGVMASPTSCMDLQIALDPGTDADEAMSDGRNCMPSGNAAQESGAATITTWRVRRRLVYTKLMLAPEVALTTQEAGDDEPEWLREAEAFLAQHCTPTGSGAAAAPLYASRGDAGGEPTVAQRRKGSGAQLRNRRRRLRRDLHKLDRAFEPLNLWEILEQRDWRTLQALFELWAVWTRAERRRYGPEVQEGAASVLQAAARRRRARIAQLHDELHAHRAAITAEVREVCCHASGPDGVDGGACSDTAEADVEPSEQGEGAAVEAAAEESEASLRTALRVCLQQMELAIASLAAATEPGRAGGDVSGPGRGGDCAYQDVGEVEAGPENEAETAVAREEEEQALWTRWCQRAQIQRERRLRIAAELLAQLAVRHEARVSEAGRAATVLQAAFRHRRATAAKAAAAVWKRLTQFTGEGRGYVHRRTAAQVCKRLVDEEVCAVAQEAMAAALASEEAASREAHAQAECTAWLDAVIEKVVQQEADGVAVAARGARVALGRGCGDISQGPGHFGRLSEGELVVYYPPVKTGAWGGGLHGELLAEVERVHGEGPSARYSILVDDCRTSALRKQLVPLDAWPHRIEGIAAGAPAAAAEWHAARRQQKAALPLGTAAVAEHPTRSGGRQRKLAREARQGLDWLAVRDAQAWMQERFGSGWYATTQANLEVSRERASFRAAFQGGEAAVVQFKERAASCGISTGSGGC